MTIPNEFCIRPYNKGDENNILELFSLSYGGREMTLPYWKWRFKDNPSGQSIINLCWHDDILVSHYSVTCLTLKVNGQTYLTGLSGTTMTHPSYRGKNLFQILARETYEKMAEMSIPLVWGFPNFLIHRTRVRDLNWVDIYEIPMFRIHLKQFIKKISQPINNIIELSNTDERFDDFWEKVQNDYYNIVCRDSSYIHWRYFSNPIERYRLIVYMEDNEIRGYAIFKRYQEELQVVDLLFGKKDAEIGEKLILFIIAQALNTNAISVSLWLNITHPLHHALERMGFRPEGPVTYMGGLVLNSQFDAELTDFRNWYYTMGDSDVF